MASSVWKGDENLKKLPVTYLRLHELAAAVLINQNTKCTTLNIELSLDSFSRKGMRSWNCCRSHIWDHLSWRLLCRLNLSRTTTFSKFEYWNTLEFFCYKQWTQLVFTCRNNWLCLDLPHLNQWTHKRYLFRLQGTDMFSKHCFFDNSLAIWSCSRLNPVIFASLKILMKRWFKQLTFFKKLLGIGSAPTASKVGPGRWEARRCLSIVFQPWNSHS